MKTEYLEIFLRLFQEKKNEIKEEAMRKVALGLAMPDFIDVDYQSADFIKDHLDHLRRRSSVMYELSKESSLGFAVDEDGYTYIKLFGDMDCIRELENWFAQFSDYMEDYHYQNQCDQPDGMTKEEFDARGEKWDKITGGQTYAGMIQVEITPDFILQSFNYDFYRMVEKMRDGRRIK